MKKKVLALVLSAAMVFSMTACGSKATDNAAPAESDAVEESAPAESEVVEESSADSEEEAPAEGTASEAASTDGFQGPTEPTKHPDSLKIAFVPNAASTSGCMVPVEAMIEVCDKYGYEYQIFDGQGTAEGCNEAILKAISWGAEAIATTSVLASGAQQALKAASDAGIPVVSGSNGTDDPNPRLDLEYDFAYDIGPGYEEMGRGMAKWISEHVEGTGKTACWSSNGSYSVTGFYDGLSAGLEELGIPYEKDCDFAVNQMGDELNNMVIAYLTKNPDTEFVYIPFDPAATLVVSALEAAGFEDVKVLGVLGNQEMCAMIAQGGLATGSMAYDSTYLGYAEMDQLFRLLNGQDLYEPHGEHVPYGMVDATNLPAEGEAWAPDFDYASAYYALWD